MKLVELITEDDNRTLSPVHSMGWVLIVGGFVLQAIALKRGASFDWVAYGTGAGAIIAATGFGHKMGGSQ